MTIETGADRCAAERDFCKRFLCMLRSLDAELDLTRIASELLSESHRCGVLQMGATDLHDLVELLRLPIEGFVQVGECRKELMLHHFGRCDVNCRGNDIVTGLAEIHMVIWMYQLAATRAAKQFGRAVRDHLIGVHVGRRS